MGFNQGIHLSSHDLEASQQSVESSVVIPADARNRRRSHLQSFLVETPQRARGVSSSDPTNSQQHSVFPRPGFLHMHHMHVLPVSPEDYQSLVSGTTPALDTKRRTRLSYCLTSVPSNNGITSPRPSPHCRGSLFTVSTGAFHCGGSWFDQGECCSQLCHVHEYDVSAGGMDEHGELQRSGVLQRQSSHAPSYQVPQRSWTSTSRSPVVWLLTQAA